MKVVYVLFMFALLSLILNFVYLFNFLLILEVFSLTLLFYFFFSKGYSFMMGVFMVILSAITGLVLFFSVVMVSGKNKTSNLFLLYCAWQKGPHR